ncbi:SprT family zinc-dependent metalloprotease [Ralstonia pseudosolanacearum]|uniref:YgjP family zinc-dependent metalloprotease n=1 Tax=Ralstonia pseudosolanacearum TaxID=1310165 RepID=UPI000E56AD41|nr:SprT family zinc-dependent metalloprotease [Ralstonia pseudosolanacearum]AXW36824.1 metal-dependent hydrolase [Ralstonia solanacearum]MCK4152870.1 M48 family metallopeptidase [Ralstonia pseudosolanacearum]BEU65497.1 SprT family zinc-dependent metalloprotease [Ralstonia pseudosolanacearum]
MPRLQYGETTIEWQFQPEAGLKRHYVTVERGRPVLLRGPWVAVPEQEALVRRRARWIREKLALVNKPLADHAIVTGSRLKYCGRSYFTEVRHTPALTAPRLAFTASRFVVECPWGSAITPEAVAPLLEGFYRERAEEKLLPRVRHWERETGLKAARARIRHFQSRWASCDAANVLQFHPRLMELAGSVQDYVIVHELCHTVEKNHTRAFWSLVAQVMPGWRREHGALEQAAFGDAV